MEEEPEEEEEEEEYEYEYEYENEDDDEEEDDYEPKMEKLTTILAVIAAILIGCIVLFLVGRAVGVFDFGNEAETSEEEEEEEKEKVEMIGVVGKNVDDVKVALLNLGLTPEIEYQESSEYEQGIVMKSSVKEGDMVEEGSNVVLTVSAGSEGVEVPDVVGMSEAEAVTELEKLGFGVGKNEGYDEYIETGKIVTQSPKAGEKAPNGATVTITVSLGKDKQMVRVPDLMGRDEEDAMAVLVEAGLQLGTVSEVNNDNAELTGLVCYQSYSVGDAVEAGTKVDISISIGPAQATYKFTDTITAPTAEEDPAYRSGTLVTVTLMADDGTQLLSTQSSSFPIQQQNITGIKSPTGYILYQYVNVTEATSIDNGDGTSTPVEGSSEAKEIRRPVSFVAE